VTGHPCHPNVSVSGGIPGVFPSHIALIEFAFFFQLAVNVTRHQWLFRRPTFCHPFVCLCSLCPHRSDSAEKRDKLYDGDRAYCLSDVR